MHTVFEVGTSGQGLYEFTPDVQSWVARSGLTEGLCTLFIQHTSASLLIQENADPDVRLDLAEWFDRHIPSANDPSMAWLRHTYEGPDDMPAHIKSALLPVSLTIPVIQGRLALGTWQGLYVVEHRSAAHRRRVVARLGG